MCFPKYRQFFTDSPRSSWSHSHSPNRVGIHWPLPSLKVYHLPFVPIASSAMLPDFFTFLPYLRTILIREHIHLIPARASLSSLGHEVILHSHLLGVRTAFSDHSLFGFRRRCEYPDKQALSGDAEECRHNHLCISYWVRIYTFYLFVVLTICRRESTILWGELFDKSGGVWDKVYVIPNALVPEHFQPGTLKTSDIGKTWLPVTLDSLTSSQWPLSYFPDLHTAKASISSSPPLSVSATPSRTFALSLVRTLLSCYPRYSSSAQAARVIDLPQMREKHNLQDRIELLGSTRPNAVCSVLMRGAIILDTSLTDPLVSPSSRRLAQGCM